MRAVVETTILGNTQPNPVCKVLLQAIAEALEEVGPAPVSDESITTHGRL
jgi:hypothetical protein